MVSRPCVDTLMRFSVSTPSIAGSRSVPPIPGIFPVEILNLSAFDHQAAEFGRTR
jgi:hypothetical protein